MSKIEAIAQAIETCKTRQVPALVQEALDAGVAPIDILNDGMIGAMTVVGERFKANEIFVPEMLVAAKAMKKGVEVLKPYLGSSSDVRVGKMAMGTVYGDLHDIGKNLVVMMIESSGFEVIDLGIDVSVDAFMRAADDPEINIIGVSALLTTTMPAMQDIVEHLNQHPRRSEFKIMVGGAPITQEFADEIGADIFTTDAASAAQAAKSAVKH